MKWIRRLSCLVIGVCIVASAAGAAPLELWFYYSTNLADDDGMATLEKVWRRAAAAGYSHVMLADPKFARLDEMDDHYFANARKARRLAAEIGLEVVPGVFQIGRSNSILAHDPNLAEGVPVRDALFVVNHGEARIVADPPVGFASHPDWKDPHVSIDHGVATIRENKIRARFKYRLRVAPFRCYHVSVQIRTEDFTGSPLIQVLADGKPIHFIKSLGVKPRQEWTTHDIAFNSLDHRELEIYFGVWRASHGSMAWRDWKIEEAGLLNVIRRPGAPCVVKGYVEGKDYEPIRDKKMGMSPWKGQYDVWHETPTIKTRLPDGTRLRVSWYQAAVIYNGQVMCCLSTPAVLDLLRDESRRVKELWGSRGYMMMHDEIRCMNWDSSCVARHMTPGALLADNLRTCTRFLGGSTGYVWGDMFDPFQNAVRDYHLVNGDLAGSWEGLDRDVIVVNWNAEKRDESLRFFSQRRNRQLISGYFDGRPEEVRDWLRSARGVEGIVGVMYTTWQQKYDDLEAFARVCREGE